MFGKNIRSARIAKSLTQKQLADLVKTTQHTISKYENDSVEPNLQMFRSICLALEVSADEILDIDLKDR